MISQITIYVSDLLTSLKFYNQLLELDIIYPKYEQLEEYVNETFVTLKTGECKLALHTGGKNNIGNDAPKFNLRVNDLKKFRAKLLDYETGKPFSPVPGKTIMSVKDPEGFWFYLEEIEEN